MSKASKNAQAIIETMLVKEEIVKDFDVRSDNSVVEIKGKSLRNLNIVNCKFDRLVFVDCVINTLTLNDCDVQELEFVNCILMDMKSLSTSFGNIRVIQSNINSLNITDLDVNLLYVSKSYIGIINTLGTNVKNLNIDKTTIRKGYFGQITDLRVEYSLLVKVRMTSPDISDVLILYSSFVQCDLNEANFASGSFYKSSFIECPLRYTVFGDIEMDNVKGDGTRIKTIEVGNYSLTLWDDMIQSGCMRMTLEEWNKLDAEEAVANSVIHMSPSAFNKLRKKVSKLIEADRNLASHYGTY